MSQYLKHKTFRIERAIVLVSRSIIVSYIAHATLSRFNNEVEIEDIEIEHWELLNEDGRKIIPAPFDPTMLIEQDAGDRVLEIVNSIDFEYDYEED